MAGIISIYDIWLTVFFNSKLAGKYIYHLWILWVYAIVVGD